MKAYAQELIAATAHALAGRSLTLEEIHDALYQLAIDISAPARRDGDLDGSLSGRRTPLANEVLPRHQRATWARAKTLYDVGED